MNITRKNIVEWVESRSERIDKHIELKGDQAMHYAVGEMIEQCFSDLTTNWVSVYEELPQPDFEVLASSDDDVCLCIFRINDDGSYYFDGLVNVTHWMPLPDPPK